MHSVIGKMLLIIEVAEIYTLDSFVGQNPLKANITFGNSTDSEMEYKFTFFFFLLTLMRKR
jgi:hypothetical protein